MRYVELIGRLFFVAMFLFAGPAHFAQSRIDYAASAGTPMPNILVPLSGVLAILGGLSILLGFYTRVGAWLIVLFLVPVTLFMHNFWIQTDPQAFQMQQINFMKNLSMLGGALVVAYFGAGPISVDAWITHHREHGGTIGTVPPTMVPR